MKAKRIGEMLVIRLETGEDLMGSLREICTGEGVMMGVISGFGGVSRLKVGIWNQAREDYDTLLVEDRDMELLNATGNLSMLNGAVHPHIHVTAADTNFQVFGGHLLEATVNNLMELTVMTGSGRIDRMAVGKWFFMDLDDVADARGE